MVVRDGTLVYVSKRVDDRVLCKRGIGGNGAGKASHSRALEWKELGEGYPRSRSSHEVGVGCSSNIGCIFVLLDQQLGPVARSDGHIPIPGAPYARERPQHQTTAICYRASGWRVRETVSAGLASASANTVAGCWARSEHALTLTQACKLQTSRTRGSCIPTGLGFLRASSLVHDDC